MKLLIVLPLMTGIGGIQASLVNLVRALPRETYSVSICVFGNRIAASTSLPEDVTILRGPRVLEYCLADFRSAWRDYAPWRLPVLVAVKLGQRALGYRRILEFATARFRVTEPFDVAIAYANDIHTPTSFVGGANDIVLRCVAAKRKLAWIHNDPTKHGLDHDTSLRTYADFDAIVNVSRTCQAIFDEIVPEYRDKSRVVYNLIDVERVTRMAAGPSPYTAPVPFTLVTVGRLDNQQKRIDRVIDACALLKARGFTNFSWHVVGDGPDAARLEAMARMAGVEDVLVFEGRKDNPFPYIRHADVLVLTSDYEAFGMVLLEARALGVPVVATRYAAAAEIVSHGVNGLLTELSAEALADMLEDLMQDGSILANLRREMAQHPVDQRVALRQFEDAIFGRHSFGA